jgi:hypothetical protein
LLFLHIMTAREKLTYLQYTFVQKLRTIDPETAPKFGNMNVHQMVEHFCYAVQVAYGKIPVPAINQDAMAEKAYRFMMSDVPFKDNTPNPLLPNEPQAITTASLGDAIDNLEDEFEAFIKYYKAEPGIKVINAFFGELDYYEQVQLLHKHAKHHARQFGF